MQAEVNEIVRVMIMAVICKELFTKPAVHWELFVLYAQNHKTPLLPTRWMHTILKVIFSIGLLLWVPSGWTNQRAAGARLLR